MTSVMRSIKARESFKPVTPAKSAKAYRTEKRVAFILGGIRLRKDEPFDVKIVAKGIAIEVKTLIDADNDRITVHPESLRQKKEEIRLSGLLAIYTVAVDTRPGKKAVYIKKGVGSFRLSTMQRFDRLEQLRQVIA